MRSREMGGEWQGGACYRLGLSGFDRNPYTRKVRVRDRRARSPVPRSNPVLLSIFRMAVALVSGKPLAKDPEKVGPTSPVAGPAWPRQCRASLTIPTASRAGEGTGCRQHFRPTRDFSSPLPEEVPSWRLSLRDKQRLCAAARGLPARQVVVFPGECPVSQGRRRQRRLGPGAEGVEQMAKNIYVGNLVWDATAEDLLELFKQHGQVARAQVIMDRETGRSRGFGFVEMDNDAEAQKAIDALHGFMFRGRALTVNEARPREEGGGRGGASGARGGYGGAGGRGRASYGSGRGGRGGYGGWGGRRARPRA